MIGPSRLSSVGMKKASCRVQSSQSAAAGQTVDQYLAAVLEPTRSTLNKVRAIIGAALPVEVIEIISYRVPAFKYRKVLIW